MQMSIAFCRSLNLFLFFDRNVQNREYFYFNVNTYESNHIP